MPQLMPFFWVNSVIMVLFILISAVFLYYHKNKEVTNLMFFNSSVSFNFNFLW